MYLKLDSTNNSQILVSSCKKYGLHVELINLAKRKPFEKFLPILVTHVVHLPIFYPPNRMVHLSPFIIVLAFQNIQGMVISILTEYSLIKHSLDTLGGIILEG